MFWFDGRSIPSNKIELDCNEIGLLYGATVFTTLRVYCQSLEHPLTNWQKHRERLASTIDKYAWQQPDWARIKAGAEILISNFPVLRITIFPDGKEFILGRNLPIDLATKQQEGIAAWLAEDSLYRRSLAEDKTGNYLGALLALQQAQKLTAQEAILIDDRANWLETSTGNLWGWRDRCWWTPQTNNILSGIARSHLLEHLHRQNIPAVENQWTSDFVRGLEAVAYSNCVVEIIPIQTIVNSQIDRPHPLNSARHPQLIDLRSAFSI
jgi:4-amino-4-deoxychorismate lyase